MKVGRGLGADFKCKPSVLRNALILPHLAQVPGSTAIAFYSCDEVSMLKQIAYMKYLLELPHRLEVSYSVKTEELYLPSWRAVASCFKNIQ